MSTRTSGRAKPRKQSENEVEDAVVTWLRIEGWIVRRQHRGTFYTKDGRPISMGDVGECDWRAFRPMRHVHGAAGYLEFEAKATGRKPDDDQRMYMAKRKRQGVVCIWADSLAEFQRQYEVVYADPS